MNKVSISVEVELNELLSNLSPSELFEYFNATELLEQMDIDTDIIPYINSNGYQIAEEQ